MRKAGVGRVSWRFDRQNVTYLIYFAKIWAIRTSDFNTVVNATKFSSELQWPTPQWLPFWLYLLTELVIEGLAISRL